MFQEMDKNLLLTSSIYIKQKEYWVNKLSGDIVETKLLVDSGKYKGIYDRSPDNRQEKVEIHMSADLSSLLIKLCKKTELSLYLVLLTGLNSLIYHYTNNEDIIVLSPLYKKNISEDTLNRYVFIRQQEVGKLTFKELLLEIRQSVFKAYENQDYPFDDLLDFLFKSGQIPANDFCPKIECQLQNIHDYSDRDYENIKDRLVFSFLWQDLQIKGHILYNPDIYDSFYLEQVSRHFISILECVVSDFNIKIPDIIFLSQEEIKQLIYTFNNTETPYKKDKVTHERFAEQVEKAPDNIAVVSGGFGAQLPDQQVKFHQHHLTYRQLNRKANQLARVLREQGVKPDDIVGIMVEISPEMIIGLMGILKAGGACLPIEPEYPGERIQFLIKDSGLDILLTHRHLEEGLEFEGHIIDLEMPIQTSVVPNQNRTTPANLENPSKPENLAYTFYTSGSTGKPKGILIQHGNVVNLLDWFGETYNLQKGTLVLQLTDYNFDPSLEDIFGTLLYGATLHLGNKAIIANRAIFRQYVEKNQIHLINFIPTLLGELLGEGEKLASLQVVICGGERLDDSLKNRLVEKDYRLYNHYGPTEITTDALTASCSAESPVTIGKPIANCQAFIVGKRNQLQPIGISGELCISGAGVARGYLNRPELTAKKFDQHLWDYHDYHDEKNQKLLWGRPDASRGGFLEKSPPGRRRQRLYKTGDLARWLPQGNIEFLGRSDHQVKIRGYRIELAEIESRLQAHKQIKDAVVAVYESFFTVEEGSADKYLCAYIVSVKDVEPSVSAAELREYLLNKLPGYMIPSHFVEIEKIPLTPNGKVDRRALPMPQLGTDKTHVAPVDEIEKKLVRLWARVLEIKEELIGINNNFFDLGGHSLKALILMSKIHKTFNIKMPLAQLFITPTIKEISDYIKEAAKDRFENIESIEKMDFYTLSSPQKRLYVLQQMNLESIAYNMPQQVILEGELNRERLEEVFKKLLVRHEALRTSFPMLGDKPFQRIHDKLEFGIDYAEIESEDEVERIIDNFIRPFDLSQAPLLRVGLIEYQREPPVNRCILMVDMHHIISDGLSDSILLGDFVNLYKGTELPPLKLQYKDYSAWQNSDKQKQSKEQQEKYWLKEFEGEVPVLDLPIDFVRPDSQSFAGSMVYFEIDKEETAALNFFARKEGATLYMVLLAAFYLLLSKLSSQEDIVVGTPAAGRRHADLENIIGIFINTLPLRNFPDGEKTFTTFLEEVKKRTLDAFANQDYPFEELVEQVAINRDVRRNPIFDVMFVLQNIDAPQAELSQFTVKPYQYEPKQSKFDLTLQAVEAEDGLAFSIEYCTKLFKQETIKRFISFLNKIVSSIQKEPAKKLAEIKIITEEEQRQILFDLNNTFAKYPDNKLIHELFERQVEKAADHIALIGNEAITGTRASMPINRIQLTYKELNKKSHQLAHLLQEIGIQPDTLVGVMVTRSVELMIGLLGILKAGGAYLPIDPGYPRGRIEFLLEKSDPHVLLSETSLTEKLRAIGFKGKRFDLLAEKSRSFAGREANYKWVNRSKRPSSGDLAYVIYTSGSTGSPKGVLVQHSNVVNFITAMTHQMDFAAGKRMLSLTTICFDIFVLETWLPLAQGMQVVMATEDQQVDSGLLAETIASQGIDSLQVTPSRLKLLYNYDNRLTCLQGVQELIVGGEVFPAHFLSHLQEVYPGKIYNVYGPTETTVWSTVKELTGSATVTIGAPIANTRVYIVDRCSGVQPPGITGDLLIGGEGVVRGYLNNPELTAEKFCPRWAGDLFEKSFLAGGDKIYKTGDLARWLWEGEIEFLGRSDHQVKVRGFRIETKEIEEHLLAEDRIKEAMVIDRVDKSGETYLCAYLVTGNTEPVNAVELRGWLSQNLPDYMIPAYFIHLDALPFTPNGKVDRKSLPDPEKTELDSGVEYAVPTTPVEEKLMETWKEILGKEKIGIHDNFFTIGGDSIKIIQIASRMNKAGYKIEMKDIFQRPRISELAPYVKKTDRVADQSIIMGIVPLTPIQKAYFESYIPGRRHNNQSIMLYAREGFDPAAIHAVFKKIQQHHDALRMIYQEDNGEIIQVNSGLDYPFSLKIYDFRKQQDALEAFEQKANQIQTGIDPEKGPLMKLAIFHLEDGDRLLIVIHHLVIDEVSWRLLLEDIETLYRQYKKGEPLELPLKSDSFKQWSEKLSQYAACPSLLKEKTYWASLGLKDIPVIKKDFPEKNNFMKDRATLSVHLDEEESNSLLTKANEAFTTQIIDILLTALGLAVKKMAGHHQLFITLEGHDREEILKDVDVTRTVGCFTSVYPVLLDISYENDLSRQIKEIKESLRQVPNKGIGFGILKYLTARGHKENLDFKYKPQISFNYLGQFDTDLWQVSSFELPGKSVGNPASPEAQREYELDISCIIINKKLRISIGYNRKMYKPGTIEALLMTYKKELSHMITFCAARPGKELTPSDFTYPELSIEDIEQLQREYACFIEDIYTTSPMQEGMLFHALYDQNRENTATYFEQLSYRLKGELNILLVEKSINELFKRHDVMRTVFVYQNFKRPLQILLKERKVDFYFEDLRGTSTQPDDREKFILEFKKKDRQCPFDLSKDVLMRISIIQPDHDQYEFTWSFHHILMDGWSIEIIIREYLEIYESYLENRTHQLPPVTPYREYIRWLENQDKQKAKEYWSAYLRGYDNLASIPKMSPPKGKGEGYEKDQIELHLGTEAAKNLNHLAGKNHVTLNIITQTIWGILLGKYNNRQDTVFGAVVSGRPFELKGVESMVGLFINTIPVRIRFEEKVKFNQLLKTVQQHALESEPYHYHQLAEIQAESPLKQNLLDHILAFENYPIADQIDGLLKRSNENKKGLTFEISDVHEFAQTNYDFNVLFAQGNQLIMKLDYNRNIYQREWVEKIGNHFRSILGQILDNEEIHMDELILLTDQEKRQILYEFNNADEEYPTGKTINELFASRVKQVPHHMAVVFEDKQLTYKELNEYSNLWASLLKKRGVAANHIVGILSERSIEMAIGIMAILKAGGAYMPLDPKAPELRNLFILRDSEARQLLVYPSLLHQYEKIQKVFSPGRIFQLDNEVLYSGSTSNLGDNNRAEDLAYVIYTSGTSGNPKGVMIEHQNINYLVFALKQRIYRNDKENFKVGVVSPYVFDASVKQIFGALLLGNCLCIVPEETRINSKELLEFYQKHSVDISDGTPAHLQLLLENEGESRSPVKHYLIGGESLSPGNTKEFLSRFKVDIPKITNLYGPTECSVDATAYQVTRDNINMYTNIPIGKPMPNCSAYIFAKGIRLQPVGIPGELCISGAGVGRGYLNRPELTAEKFKRAVISHSSLVISSSKSSTNDQCPMTNDRLYRTGDLARWLPDGNIEFLGRLDSQIKIRGFRIEPGEIEEQLLKHNKIREALVIDIDKTGESGEKSLCAYIVPGGVGLLVTQIKDYLGQSLPQYMIPTYVVVVEKIPLTLNGKVDRRALPAPVVNKEKAYAAPRNEIEKRLAEIWAVVLGIDDRVIGIHDNFFDLGGHSLKVTRLVSEIHKALNMKLLIKDVFNISTIKGLSGYIKGLQEDRYTVIKPAEKKDYYVLSSAQRRLYVIQQTNLDSSTYNILQIVLLEGKLKIERLKKIFKKLISRHENLRTSFEIIEGNPVQRIHNEAAFALEYDNLENRESQSGNSKGEKEIIKHFIRPFNLNEAPLIRAGVIKLKEKKHILMVDLHHIITDGISQNILIQEFMALYSREKIPRLRLHYKDFSEWQNSNREKEIIKKQGEYWLKVFEGQLPVLKVPTDYPRPTRWSYEGGEIRFEIDEKETKALKNLALQEGVTMHMLLLTIYTVLLSKLSGQNDIIVGMAIAGRPHPDLEHVIGMFLNMLAIRNHPKGEKNFKDFLNEVRDRTIEAYDNQEYQFEDLVEKLHINREVNRHPLFDVAFGLQNLDIPEIKITGLELKSYQYEQSVSKLDILMVGVESEKALFLSIQYNSKLFKEETIRRFSVFFKRIVTAVVENPRTKLKEIKILTGEEKNRILSKKRKDEKAIQVDFDI